MLGPNFFKFIPAQMSLTGEGCTDFTDLQIVDDIPRAYVFHMDSRDKLFRFTSTGRLTVPTVKAIDQAAEYHLPVADLCSLRDPLWKQCVDEVKGHVFTDKREMFKGT